MFSCVTSTRVRAFGDAGNAEVENLQPAMLIDHEVGRLDVPMNDAGFVRVLQTGAQLHHQPELLRDRHRLAALDLLGQGLAPDVLHHDERRALELAGVVDVDDVGMVQRGERPGLTGKPLAQIARIEVGEQQLERDEPVGVGVGIASQVERAHPAGPDEGLDVVPIDPRSACGTWDRVRKS